MPAIRDMFRAHHDEGIRPRSPQPIAHRAQRPMKLGDDRRVCQVRAARDARGMTHHTGKYQAHTSAIFSCKPVVMA
jgi:hypothetical protein